MGFGQGLWKSGLSPLQMQLDHGLGRSAYFLYAEDGYNIIDCPRLSLANGSRNSTKSVPLRATEVLSDHRGAVYAISFAYMYLNPDELRSPRKDGYEP
jgi:hypothetical protein